MKYFFALVAPLAFAASCSTFSDIESGLAARMGQPVNALIDDIGFPSQTLNVADRKLYVWSTAHSVNSLQQTTGFGGVPTLAVGPAVQYQCQIKVEVDDREIMRDWEMNGNIGGCQRYAQQLR